MSPALDETPGRHRAPARSAPWCPNTVKTCMRRTCMTRLWKARFAGRFNVVFAGNISPAQNLPLLVECAQAA